MTAEYQKYLDKYKNAKAAAVTEMVAAVFHAGKEFFMSREPFETTPDVMDAKQLAKALQISKAGEYNLLNDPDFPTLRIGGRKLVMKNELVEWLKSRTTFPILSREKLQKNRRSFI